jgi:hypothetical protein
MNCPTIRRRLLGSESPNRPDEEVRRHLDDCPRCRDWHQRLAEIEVQLSQLPVPASTAMDRLLEQIWSPKPPPLPRPVATPRPWLPSPKERARQKLALAFALAATLLVLALGFWAWPRSATSIVAPEPSKGAFTFASLEAQRDSLLQAARTPTERVETLAAFADRLRRQAHGLARIADVERLATLARFYEQLVCNDLPHQARTLAPEERPRVLNAVRAQLIEAESELERQRAEPRTETAAGAALQKIARSARGGHDQLGELLRNVV